MAANYRARWVDVYRHDGVVLPVPGIVKPKHSGGVRGKISATTPSSDSLRRLVFLLNNCEPAVDGMLTLTMPPVVFRELSPKDHKRAFRSACERLRQKGLGRFVWVREFTSAGVLHWHVFIASSGFRGEPDFRATNDWSKYWAGCYRRILAKLISTRPGIKGALTKMERASARAEALRSSAGGRYAAKEGAKRFQKQAPEGWHSFAWWRGSRAFELEPRFRVLMSADDLSHGVWVDNNGREVATAHKLQLGLVDRFKLKHCRGGK